MSNDRDNAYYDSARAKVDRTDFASSRMSLHSPRRPQRSGGLLRIVIWLVAAVVLLAVAKRYLF